MPRVASASLATLRRRAEINARIRAFFAARDVLEVETPALSAAGISDLALDSITASSRSLGPRLHYLHTSPEYAMKRLLAAGSGDIYQLCRVFRDDELGRWHQPEFTMLEWYRVGWDDLQLMVEVGDLFRAIVGHRRVTRVSYSEALEQAIGVGAAAETGQLIERLSRRGVDVPAGLSHDAVLDLAFATVVVEGFAHDALTFVHDYPASQAALARLKPGTPTVAARFEVFAGTIELANGFHELTDAVEQRRRFESELAARASTGRHVPPLDEALLAALAHGLPDCAGVAVGVDRLVAFALGLDGVGPAMSFTHSAPFG
jgi:elongation factor P--(R)-beta-lysine ligase